MCQYLVSLGYSVGNKHVRCLIILMGCKPKTSTPSPENKRYPYLLRGLDITGSNQVWSADITYIPMCKGFLYLVAIINWHCRKFLSWRLSNAMETDFCVAALEEDLAKHSIPDNFNTDQDGFRFLQAFCWTKEFASPRTGVAVGWTMSLSNTFSAKLQVQKRVHERL